MTALRPSGDFDRSYKQDGFLIRKSWQWVLLLFFILLIGSSPYWAPANIVIAINRIGYTIIALQGLNILTGYTGQISLGQAAFMLTGGYISALSVTYLGISPFLAFPIAALGTGFG